MRNSDKLHKIYNDVMVELYKNSEPKADFNKLMEEFKITNKDFFNDYLIDQNLFKKIVDNQLRQHKLSLFEKKILTNSIYLGAGPKFKK